MSNCILYIALLFSLISCSGHQQQQANLLFKRGNKEAATGNYQRALAMYRQLDQHGIERAELYCNMGNAYLKLGRRGLARYYYEHGLQLAPWDSQLLANRQLVLEQLGIKSAPPALLETSFFQRIADQIIKAALSGLLLCALVLGISFYSGKKRYVRELRMVASTLLISGAGLVAVLLFLRHWPGQAAAIVVAPTTAVRMGPGEGARQLAKLKEGQKVLVIKQYQGWIKVSVPAAQQGWIKLSNAACLYNEE